MTWTVIDYDNGRNVQSAPTRAKAEEMAETAREFGSENVEIVAPDAAETDGGKVEIVETPEEDPRKSPDTTPDEPGELLSAFNIDMDPLDVLPGWMVTEVTYSDRGDSTTTVNKRGCQVIAEYLGLQVRTEALTPACETNFEFATYKATVWKPDGRTFTGHGTARADGDDQGEHEGWKLDMMAETRAYKRAVKTATGGGLEAFVKERADE